MKYRVIIVGAGPAGYFTAQAFQKLQNEKLTFSIDIIERLPTPYGLVRSGVAPDHPKIKTISNVFDKIAKTDTLKLYANVELGRDVSLKDLSQAYDVVVLATGASEGRKLGVKGENLFNSFSASEFVQWYNGHPDFSQINVDFEVETAVIIGAGNVALDVARLLIKDPIHLNSTDIAEHALKLLKLSKIKNVVICARRGPEHSSFTNLELRELTKLDKVEVNFEHHQIEAALNRTNVSKDIDKELRNNLDTMSKISKLVKTNKQKIIDFKFLLTPVEIKGNEKVEEVKFRVNEIKNGQIFATEKNLNISTGLFISAIGYEPVEFPGIKREEGRIKNIAGHVEKNIYVTGWAKRGAKGVIGTNKSDSADVVDLIISRLRNPKNTSGIESLLKPNHKIIDYVGWEKINASELISGEIVGRPRIKEVNWETLINLGTN